MLVGIPCRIIGKFIAALVEIGVEFFEPVITPDKIIVLNTAFPESELGTVIKLGIYRMRLKEDIKKQNAGDPEKFPVRFIIPGIHHRF
jgi:hypothetical protein